MRPFALSSVNSVRKGTFNFSHIFHLRCPNLYFLFSHGADFILVRWLGVFHQPSFVEVFGRKASIRHNTYPRNIFLIRRINHFSCKKCEQKNVCIRGGGAWADKKLYKIYTTIMISNKRQFFTDHEIKPSDHLRPVFFFYILRMHQKTFCVRMFSGGVEMEHWLQIS